MTEIESLLRKIRSENQQHREASDAVASRIVGAITRGDYGAISNIVREIHDSPKGEESGAEPMETGDADGAPGAPISAEPSEAE